MIYTTIHKKNIRFLLFIMLFQLIKTRFVFGVDSNNESAYIIPYEKKKNVRTDIYEDRARATNLSLVLSDGVGGWKFPSSYMAELTVEIITNALIVQQYNAENEELLDNLNSVSRSSEFLTNPLLQVLKTYTSVGEQTTNEYLQKNYNREDLTLDEEMNIEKLNGMSFSQVAYLLGGAGTVLGAYLKDADTEEPKLRMMQMGDSLFTLMKRQDIGDDKAIYLPELVSDDMQKQFNAPSQLCSNEIYNMEYAFKTTCGQDQPEVSDYADAYDLYLKKNLKDFEIPIKDSDILILASDGLFDNIAGPILSIFINYVLRYLEIQNENGVEQIENPDLILDELVDDFIAVAVAQQNTFYNELNEQLNSEGRIRDLQNIPSSYIGHLYCKNEGYEELIAQFELENQFIMVERTMAEERDSSSPKVFKIVIDNPQLKTDILSGENVIEDTEMINTVQERDNQIPLFQNALIQQKVSNPILEEDQNNLIIKDNKPATSSPLTLERMDGLTKSSFVSGEDIPKNNIKFIRPQTKVDRFSTVGKKKSTIKPKVLNKIQQVHKGSTVNKQKKGKVPSAINQTLSISGQNFQNLSLANKSSPSSQGSSHHFLFNKRRLVIDILQTHQVNLMDLVYYPTESRAEHINNVTITEMVQQICELFAVKQNLLPRYGYGVLSAALAGAAFRISRNKQLKVSPFSMKALEFGMFQPMVKPDDISVIASMIVNQTEEQIKQDIYLEDKFEDIFDELMVDIYVFLSNTVSITNYYQKF